MRLLCADAEEEPADEVAPAGEEKSAEEGNSAQPPAAEDEEKKRVEHEAAEAQRKAEFDAKQQAKKAAEREQIARLEAMSDEEVIAASTQRVSTDVEKLTRRNMKECVSEHTVPTAKRKCRSRCIPITINKAAVAAADIRWYSKRMVGRGICRQKNILPT